MNIYQLLKKDHSKVKGLFKQMKSKARTEQRPMEEIFAEIEEELTMHIEGEEHAFYPALEQNEGTREKVLKSYEEHTIAKMILKDMGGMSKDDEKWVAKLAVLRDIVGHHIEEEEGELFKLAREVLNKDQTQEITKRFEEEKKKTPVGAQTD